MHRLDDLDRLIRIGLEALGTVNPADTGGALAAAWAGFAVIGCLGGFMASWDPNAAVEWRNAEPVLAPAAETLQPAPSLPVDVHGLDAAGEATTEMLVLAGEGILAMTMDPQRLKGTIPRSIAYEKARAPMGVPQQRDEHLHAATARHRR